MIRPCGAAPIAGSLSATVTLTGGAVTFSGDVTANNLNLPILGKLNLEGAAGNSYITADADDDIGVYAGAVRRLRILGANADFTGDLRPAADNTRALGTASRRFASAAIAGTVVLDGDLDHNGSNIGVFGTAPTTKKTVTGSRGGNAALASLLTQLAAYGLITDSST